MNIIQIELEVSVTAYVEIISTGTPDEGPTLTSPGHPGDPPEWKVVRAGHSAIDQDEIHDAVCKYIEANNL